MQRMARREGMAEDTLDEAVGMKITGYATGGMDDQDFAAQIAAKTGGRVAYGGHGSYIVITYPTTQDRAMAAAKIRKMFPDIKLYKTGGNMNAIDEQGVAEGDNDWSGSQGNFAGDKPFNLGGDVANRLDVNDTVSYFGEKATILAMSKDRTVSRIDLKSGITQNVKTSDLKRVGQGVAEQEKVGHMDADRFDDAMARLKRLAGAGPLKTVWDPQKRVYQNVPTAVQPQIQPKK